MIEALIVLFLVFVFVVIPVVFFAMVILAAKQGYRAGKIANRVLKRYE